jgi:hypothetical protein
MGREREGRQGPLETRTFPHTADYKRVPWERTQMNPRIREYKSVKLLKMSRLVDTGLIAIQLTGTMMLTSERRLSACQPEKGTKKKRRAMRLSRTVIHRFRSHTAPTVSQGQSDNPGVRLAGASGKTGVLLHQGGETKAKPALEKPQKCRTKPSGCRKQRPRKSLSDTSHIRPYRH